MKPTKAPIKDKQMDLFRLELSKIIDPRHSLVKLSRVVNWNELDNTFGITFCDDNGRPGKPTRLMVALHYLKFIHDLSDEAVVSGWIENPYWQCLSGMKYFEHKLPCDPSSMTRWRKRIGEAGAEKLLEETIKAELKLKAAKKTQLKRINIDTTVIYYSVCIISYNGVGFCKIIIGKIRPHPGLGHHGRRKLNYFVDFGVERPHIITFFQRAIPPVF